MTAMSFNNTFGNWKAKPSTIWLCGSKRMENSKELKYHFPGTIVNIEIDQNDTNIYKYEQIKNEKDMDDEIF